MTGYEWLVVDPATAEAVGDLSAAVSRTATWRLGDGATASASGTGASVEAVFPLRTDLLLTWKPNEAATARGLWRGRFGPWDGDVAPARFDKKVDAADYRTCLHRRHALAALDWTGIDIADAGWELIHYTQHVAPYPGGPWGIGRGQVDPIATADVQVPVGRAIDDAINDLAKRHPGFDWWISPDMQYEARAQRGTTRDFALELGTTVTQASPALDTSGYANLVLQTGAEGLTPAIRHATDLDTAARPEGRWETQAANPDLTTQAAVNGAGDITLARAATLSPAWTLQLTPGAWTPDDAWIGDYVPLRGDGPGIEFDTVERIVEITVTDTGAGTVTPQITVSNSLAQDVAAQMRSLPALLGQALRR